MSPEPSRCGECVGTGCLATCSCRYGDPDCMHEARDCPECDGTGLGGCCWCPERRMEASPFCAACWTEELGDIQLTIEGLRMAETALRKAIEKQTYVPTEGLVREIARLFPGGKAKSS